MTSSLIDRLNAVSEQVALKRPVRVASTVNLTLSAFQTIDGVTPAASDENLRVLVKNQMTPSENGIYLMTTGSWERADDFDGNRDVVKGTRVPVTESNLGANKTYVVTAADPIIIDESGLTFSEITESLVTSEFAKPRAPVSTLSSDTILTALDAGKQIDVDCTSADRVITLPAVSDPDLRNGDRITIRYAAGTNQITIACQGSDGINGASSLALTSRYESLTLAANDSNWAVIGHARPFAAGSVVFIRAVSRTLLTPPVSPVPGARYIIAASGVPMGDWSSYANNDVIEANGQGGWIRYSPSESWHAYVEAENKVAFFTGTAWQGLPNTDDPAESALGYALFQDRRASAVEGGTAAISTWTERTLQTSVVNRITGCSLASNAVTLPAGKYLIVADASFYMSDETHLRLKSTTTATVLYGPQARLQAVNQGQVSHLVGVLDLAAQEAFKLEYWATSASGLTSGLGKSITGDHTGSNLEIYASVQIVDLSSLQGGKGDPGDIGPQGFAGFKYQFSSSNIQADPGAGFLRLNNAAFGSVTAAVIDALSAEGAPGPDVSNEIAAWGSTGGIFKITKVGAEQNWITYNVLPSGVVNHGGYLSLALTPRSSAGSLTNADFVSVQFSPKGEPGATGSSFPIYDYTFSSAVPGDPGGGKFLFNVSSGWSFASINTLYISKTDRLGVLRDTDIAAWDDDGASGNRGYLYLMDAATAQRIATLKVTGTLSDNTLYDMLPVTYISGAAPLGGTRVALMFVPAGATGSIGGTTGLVDNTILRADGVGGSVIQPARSTEDDAGKYTVNFVDSAADAIASVLKLSRATSGTPAVGIGVRQEFEIETASGNNMEVAAAIDVVSTDVTGGSEDFDFSMKLMTAGAAAAEVVRFLSTGAAYLAGSAAKSFFTLLADKR